MTRAIPTESVVKSKPSSSKTVSRLYPLRSQSSKSALHVTPSKLSPVKLSDRKPISSPTPLTPSKIQCYVCQGIEELRAAKLNDAVQEFISKLDTYRELSKSLGENSTDLEHAITTIRHFILHLEPKKVENFFTSIETKITSVSDNLADLSNYVTMLDSVHKTVNSTNALVNSKVGSNDSQALGQLDTRLEKLESICSQLSTKLESFDISALQQYESRLNNIINESAPTASNSLHKSPTPVNAVPSTSNTRPHPTTNTVLIIGDSNTKYVNINSPSVRIPTFVIEDIDPTKCMGYHKILVHVGINNLKTRNCRGQNDVIRHFNLFMHKLHLIKQYCPYAKVVVSPILPTGIFELNERAVMFNRMLFSRANWFDTLHFGDFCGYDGNLSKRFRCYSNVRDNIHLGAVGIRALISKIKHAFSFRDNRSYAGAVKTT